MRLYFCLHCFHILHILLLNYWQMSVQAQIIQFNAHYELYNPFRLSNQMTYRINSINQCLRSEESITGGRLFLVKVEFGPLITFLQFQSFTKSFIKNQKRVMSYFFHMLNQARAITLLTFCLMGQTRQHKVRAHIISLVMLSFKHAIKASVDCIPY